jgi:hypothetical protein
MIVCLKSVYYNNRRLESSYLTRTWVCLLPGVLASVVNCMLLKVLYVMYTLYIAISYGK